MNKERLTINNEHRVKNKERRALSTLLFVICYLLFFVSFVREFWEMKNEQLRKK